MGLENSIIAESFSASRFEIDLSAESFLFVEIHILVSFSVDVNMWILIFLFEGTNT
jgi:hypothetical protein